MITADNLQAIALALRRFGVSEAQAERYAVLIGDTPEVDGAQVVVRDDDGTELARVPASVLE